MSTRTSTRRALRRPALALFAAATGVMLTGGVAVAAPPSPLPGTGPSTAVPLYVLPANGAVQLSSVLSVNTNDPTVPAQPSPPKTATNGYLMMGIPDGLGAYKDQASGKTKLFMNHEISSGGSVRAHGANGAFVSTYTINPDTLEVETGADLMTTVNYFDYASASYLTQAPPPAAALSSFGSVGGVTFTRAFSRFCSSDLARPINLYNAASGKGYNGNIYLTGEESGANGRAMAMLEDGTAWQLPRLGLFSYENILTAPSTGDKTVVLANEDNANGKVAVYVGDKQSTGTAIEQAGLTNGVLQYLKVTDPTFVGTQNEAAFRVKYPKGTPAPIGLTTLPATQWSQDGTAQNAAAVAGGALLLNRPEDGAWDPSNPNDFYFVTTGSGVNSATPHALWRIRFSDRANPAAGGTLTMLLDGFEAPLNNPGQRLMQMPDNITIDKYGHLIIQEDPGNNAYVSKIWAYDIPTGRIAQVATFDPAQFTSPNPGFITIDEESSGVIDAEETLGKGFFWLDAQVHKTITNTPADPKPVEMGQLMAMRIDFDSLFGQFPTPVVPDAPFAVLLPIGALVAVGGAYYLMRRRHAVA